MKIDDLTIGEAKKLVSIFSNNETTKTHSLKIGEIYLVQTVTNYYSGRLLSVTDTDIVLGDAAWIADTGITRESF
jgi:hypothetical protein